MAVRGNAHVPAPPNSRSETDVPRKIYQMPYPPKYPNSSPMNKHKAAMPYNPEYNCCGNLLIFGRQYSAPFPARIKHPKTSVIMPNHEFCPQTSMVSYSSDGCILQVDLGVNATSWGVKKSKTIRPGRITGIRDLP